MEEEKYYFIKLTAKDSQNKNYVLVCIVVPENKSEVDRLDAIVSHNLDTILISESYSYRDCRNKIQRNMLSGSASQSATQSLVSYFKDSFSSESFMIEFLHYLEHDELEKLKMLLMQNVGRVMGRHDLDSEAQIYVSKVTKSELEAATTKSEPKPEQEAPTFIRPQSVPEGAILVDYQLILSPVTGTALAELKKDDMIMVKIIPDTEEAVAIIRDMGLKDSGGTIHPCPASIVEINKQETGTEIIVKIKENVYGRCLEEEFSVKVKMYESVTQSQEESAVQEVVVPNERNWVIPAILIIGVLSILWIIVYFFI